MLRENVSFFHGLSKSLHFARVQSRIGGPLSTTSDFSVALNFATSIEGGMILKFEYDGSAKYTEAMAYIDCCWMSDFASEQEAFFRGGTIMMSLRDICSVSDVVTNYSIFVNGLVALENFVHVDYVMLSHFVSKTNKALIHKFLSHELFRYYQDEKYHTFRRMPEYIGRMLRDVCAGIRDCRPNQPADVFDYFFRYDNGWIKLDVLCTVFPRLQRITLDNVELKPRIFRCILSFLSNNPTTELRQIILHRIDEKAFTKEAAIQRYDRQFGDVNWYLFTTKYQNPKYPKIDQQVEQLMHDLQSMRAGKEWSFKGIERKLGNWLIISSQFFSKPPSVDGQVIDPKW